MGVFPQPEGAVLPSSSAMRIDFSSHRRTGTGYHVACVLNLGKTNTAEGNVEDGRGDVLGLRFKAQQGESQVNRSKCS